MTADSKKLTEAGDKLEAAGKVLSASLDKLGDKSAERESSFSTRADAAGEKAYEFRKLQAKATGELAKVVITLAATQVSKDTVKKTIASLEVVLAVLGRIKTAFSNTKMFWEGVQKHCLSLSSGASNAEGNLEFIDIPNFQDDLMLAVESTALGWMALAHINYRAYNAMQLAGASVDDAMNNIPGASECDTIVNQLAPEILSQITAESTAI